MTVQSDVTRGPAREPDPEPERDPEPLSGPGPEPRPSAASTAMVLARRGRRGWLRRWHEGPAAAAGLIGLVGLLVQTSGYAAGWRGHTDVALVLFYVGLVVLLTPYAVLFLSAAPSRRSRISAVVCFGLLMYASWLAVSPVYAAAFDESLHVATLADLTSGAGWFAPNTMLPVSPHYPGLELAATAVHWLTGLPLMACQVLVVALARTTLVVGLYLLGSRLTRSARGGGVVVLLYAASPQFYFFNAMFSYQTMALALLVGAVAFQLRAFAADPEITGLGRGGPWRALLGVQACFGALVLTHHLTSWLTIAALWLLALVLAVSGDVRRARLAVVSAQIGLLLVVAWSAVIAPLLASYLGPVMETAGSEILEFIRMDGGQREALTESPDNAAPLWETVAMAGSILLWVAMLLPALRAAVAGRSLGRSPARYVLLALAAAFPALFVVRVSKKAAEIADRSSTFVTLGLVLVVTAWLMSRTDSGARVLDRVLHRVGLRTVVPAALVLLVGGLILGSGPDWQRTPGPYLAGAEQRSVDAETLAVADWAGRYLPAGSRIAADTTFGRILPTVAPVDTVTSGAGSVDVTPLFINRTLDMQARQILIGGEVDFVVVDRRWDGETVRSGGFTEGSSGYGPEGATLTSEQLGKFEDAPGFRLVLDGPVQVYDVRSLRAEPQVFADRESPGQPGDWRPVRTAITAFAALLAAVFLLTRRRRGGWRRADAVPLLVALPALVVVGALGVTVGLSPVLGAVLGLAAVAGAVVVLRRTTEKDATWSDRVVLVTAACVLLAVVATLSTTSAWQARFGADVPPAPPSAGALS